MWLYSIAMLAAQLTMSISYIPIQPSKLKPLPSTHTTPQVDVFLSPHLNRRLQQAIAGVLRSYDLDLSHLVMAKAWYDVHMVSVWVARSGGCWGQARGTAGCGGADGIVG